MANHKLVSVVEAVKLNLEIYLFFLFVSKCRDFFCWKGERAVPYSAGIGDCLPRAGSNGVPKKSCNKVGLRLDERKRCCFVYLVFPLNSCV